MSKSDLNNLLAAGLSAAFHQPVVIDYGETENQRRTTINCREDLQSFKFVPLSPAFAISALSKRLERDPVLRPNYSAPVNVKGYPSISIKIEWEPEIPASFFRTNFDKNFVCITLLPFVRIDVLKWMVHTETGIPFQLQKLSFEGQDLENMKTLERYGIRNKSVIKLTVSLQVSIKTVAGRSFEVEVKPYYTVQMLKTKVWEMEGIQIDNQKMLLGGEKLKDDLQLSNYDIQNGSIIHLIPRYGEGKRNIMNVPSNELAPYFNFKYPEVDKKEFMRGGRKLERPLGCQKYAINVCGRYEDDDWLGASGAVSRTHDVEGEWPVSYHGTEKSVAAMITEDGFELRKGKRFKFGKGVYSTPTPSVAEKYAKVFEHEGKKYKLIFMNRINPDFTREIEEPRIGTYYITSDETQIRPYAILIKEIK